MAYRIDRYGELKPAQKMPDGRVRFDAYITRTGVFEYRNSDGSIRREYRPPEEVFSPEALASFEMVPVTNNHPPMHLDAATAKGFAVGATGENVRQDGDKVRCGLMVFDAPTVADMVAGKLELSCGYAVEVVNTPGVSPQGEHYDAIQRKIRGNHVAVVDVGRAGPDVRARMDEADGECAIMVRTTTRTDEILPEDTMTLEQMQAALATATENAAKEKVRADAAEGKAIALEARAVAAEASTASEKARADKAEQDRTDAAAAEPARIRARVELETKAASYLGDEYKADASDRDLMVAVVKRLDSFDVPADASAEAVSLCFANACARAGKATTQLGEVRRAATTNDAALDAEAEATRKMREATANRWKGN